MTLTVIPDKLKQRADVLEVPLRRPPADNPQPACTLDFVRNAVADLAYGADQMRDKISRAETEWKSLAESLRNAAFAYEVIDEGSAAALGNETSAPQAVMVGAANEDFGPATLGAGSVLAAPVPIPTEFREVEVTARQLEESDQGASLARFADAWEQYKSVLRDATKRFVPIEGWSSDDITGACQKVQANFNAYATWLNAMATLCQQLADQARAVVDAHKKARQDHVYAGNWRADGRIKYDHQTFVDLEKFILSPAGENFTRKYPNWWPTFYTGVSKESLEAIAPYRASLKSVAPVNPDAPPPAQNVDKPKPPKPFVPTPDQYWEWEWAAELEERKKHNLKPATKPKDVLRPPPKPDPANDPNITPGGGGSGGLSGLPSMPMMPMMPSAPQPDPAIADALKDLKGQGGPKLPHGGGVKPASFGGAGGPGTPLQSWGEDSATPKAGAAGPAGPGRGVPGVGGTPGAMGGGMGGAPAAGGDKGGKGKRVEGDEEALYTEERSWTEGVIGLRAANDVPKQ
ncbi:MAG: hypothetical protein VYA67_25440 [Actinomycetota bacterium]|uniref:Alanine and glycine rich protein n=1 Tax=Mycobacterium lentiflavum TaxID=141349 RepID=A0ABY3UVK7_MYCLN|nr:hypothetical protein [Mycobacterium lentiflavum]MEE3067237.1 hypothetical protein [Actinomycetota bacterium]ULP43595.1 hypothetical protein MJO58_06380 [Mycobacterium lentiflavum]